MRSLIVVVLSLLARPVHAEEIGAVGYRFKWLGPNDKIVVEAFDDPDVPGVTCCMSHARTFGIEDAIGFAEDPGEVSVACRQGEPIDKSQLAGCAIRSKSSRWVSRNPNRPTWWDGSNADGARLLADSSHFLPHHHAQRSIAPQR